MTEPEKMISVAEAAERLLVTTRSIQRWIKLGYFPNAHKKSPQRTSPFVIPESDIIAYEARLRAETGSQVSDE